MEYSNKLWNPIWLGKKFSNSLKRTIILILYYNIDILPLIGAPMGFEVLRSGAYWRAAHKRGRCFFQSKNIYFGSHSCEHRRILTKELFGYFNFKSNFNLQLCWSRDLLWIPLWRPQEGLNCEPTTHKVLTSSTRQ